MTLHELLYCPEHLFHVHFVVDIFFRSFASVLHDIFYCHVFKKFPHCLQVTLVDALFLPSSILRTYCSNTFPQYGHVYSLNSCSCSNFFILPLVNFIMTFSNHTASRHRRIASSLSCFSSTKLSLHQLSITTTNLHLLPLLGSAFQLSCSRIVG